MLQIKNTLGGGKPEGLYAWKKCEYLPKQTIVNPTFHIKANVSTQKAIITSDDINFKAFGILTDSNNFYQSREPEFCNFMNGFKNSNSSVNFVISASTYSGQLELNYSNNSYWNAFTKMTPTDTGAELTASNLFKTTIDDTLQYTGTKTIAAKIGEFISYVVSDKETAYPDGGEKGGYWYEKVSDVKMASGSITPSSSPTNLVIKHGLGKTPKQFYLLLNEADFTSYKVVVSAYKNDIGHRVLYASPNRGIYKAYAELSEEFPETIFDETNITVPTCYSSANKNTTSYQLRYYGTYKWFAIAE